ncbi:MAG: IS481 family transposase, partial [Pseudonocardiaceae bacterium]
SSIGRIPPQRAWQSAPAHGGPADLPRQTDATVHVLTVVSNGTDTLGNHTLSIGLAHTATTVTLLRNGYHDTAYAPHGEPLGHLMINPDRRYQGTLTQLPAL